MPYGHILGTKAPDGKPIDIFLGPDAYPNNPNLKNLPVVVIDQKTLLYRRFDEPKVMFGFRRSYSKSPSSRSLRG